MDKEQVKKIVNRTIADYNLIADKFSSTRSRLSHDLLNLAAEADKDGQILDYGCGNGRLCKLFKPNRYLGVDASSKLLDIAKNTYPEYSFELIAASDVPKNRSFDIIFCLAMVHHLPNESSQQEILKKFYDILTSGGKLILTSWYIDGSDTLVAMPFRDNHCTIQRQIFSFSQSALEAMILKANFHIISSKIVPRNSGKYSNIEIIAQK